ncbi:DUF6087 family protein [Kitasatospora sp. YST-16]|uniref:DUF6087 family protein n=1 Tax=Kitasatospora sp. YST-16 TaxID=2998080 RepID=UPI002284D978|nr:DUF6087 family protein [Kitasatospora sp. YST-16]WAL73537.1 DUF6087 family protein [Kitasatospora sp. YST-16]WNW39593.1 DUF6087 family protein [Streptomyces sp. Li-HN-5-13]
MPDDEEPLGQWLERRDARRRRPGTRKAVPLDGSRATHLDPQAPRMVLEWDGYAWQPIAVADGYAAAQRQVHRIEGDGVIRGTVPRPSEKPTGRHRKP